MHISRLFVRNFRNFRQFDVRIQDGVTCIIGENNSGKTNLLHALRLLLDGSLSPYRRRLRPEDFSTGLDPSQPEQVIVSVEFTGFQGVANQEALLWNAVLRNGDARLSYRFRPRAAIQQAFANLDDGDELGPLSSDDYSWEIAGGGDDIDLSTIAWNEALGTRFDVEDLQQGFHVTYMEALRDVETRLGASRTSPLQQIIEHHNIPTDERDALVQHLRGANDSINASATIAALGQNLTAAFRAAAGATYAMEVGLGLGEASFGDISRGLKVLLSGYGMTNLDPGRNGLGLNNVLYVSLLLNYFERRMADGKSAGQLLLVEEPEAHLHPQLQRILLSTLRGRNVQILITTHSTHITSGVPLSAFGSGTLSDQAAACTSAE